MLFIAAFFLIVMELQSQELVNGMQMTSIYVELDNNKTIEAHSTARMILPYTATSVVLYQDDQYTYWAEFDFRQCGKKAKLKSKTYLELNNGEIIDGNSSTIKRKINKGQTDWIVGINEDSFKIQGKDDSALNAGFNYAMRFTNWKK